MKKWRDTSLVIEVGDNERYLTRDRSGRNDERYLTRDRTVVTRSDRDASRVIVVDGNERDTSLGVVGRHKRDTRDRSERK